MYKLHYDNFLINEHDDDDDDVCLSVCLLQTIQLLNRFLMFSRHLLYFSMMDNCYKGGQKLLFWALL